MDKDPRNKRKPAPTRTSIQKAKVVADLFNSSYNCSASHTESESETSEILLTDINTRSDGSHDWDKITRAVMQHRQTPLNDNFLSPAQILFGGLQHPYQLPNSLSNPDTWYPETV